jgi:type IV secretory pathway TrbL component
MGARPARAYAFSSAATNVALPARSRLNTGSSFRNCGHVGLGVAGAGGGRFDQTVGQRIDDLLALGGAAADEVHPGGQGQGQAVDRAAGLQGVGDRAQDAERQLLRAVPGDLAQQVADLGVAEAGQDRLGVGGQVQAARRGQGRDDVLDHQVLGDPASSGSLIASNTVSWPFSRPA